MLGRGVKRKWSSVEELEAEVVPDASAMEDGEAAAAAGGRRRVRTPRPPAAKLQRYQAGVELSLRRSVLLINTLRRIQDEMRGDGGAAGGAPDVLLGAVRPDSRLLGDDFREDVSVTCPGCAEGEAPTEPPPQEACAPPEQRPPPAAFSEAVSAMGYLGDIALDDIFEDIDTSMYETSDLPSAWAAGPLWPVSVSLWPDDDPKGREAAPGESPALRTEGTRASCRPVRPGLIIN
uniref:SERTA domain-containing protein n=1 Tax=Salarias fasciatus TaxID=181472 RepID=A0A672HDK3_SALFA